MTHRIATITYLPRTPDDDAAMTCSCGTWQGRLGDWHAHKYPGLADAGRERLARGRATIAAKTPEQRAAENLKEIS